MSGFDRRDFLKFAAALPLAGLLPGVAFANAPNAKRIILVRAFGGWDVTFCMDPRLTSCSIHGPDFDASNTGSCSGVAGKESIEGYGGLKIMINDDRRPAVTTFFDAYASQTLVVNGISVGSIVHPECERRILTGSREQTAADIGTLAAVAHGGATTLPYLDLTGGARVGAYAAQTGMLGQNNQILALVDRTLSISGPVESGLNYPLYVPSQDAASAIETYLSKRRAQWEPTLGGDARSQKIKNDLAIASARKAELLASRDLLKANLTFGSGGSMLEQNSTTVALMSAGICHSASISTGVSWDTHDDIADQHLRYELLFTGLTDLVGRLKAENLFDETMIVVLSEMTRTPKLNKDGGKDHWPVTSAMVIGGSVDGGRSLGGTDEDNLDAEQVNLKTGQVDSGASTKIGYSNFIAGLLHATGVDSQQFLPGTEVLHGFVDEA
jgi:hypothetical protein